MSLNLNKSLKTHRDPNYYIRRNIDEILKLTYNNDCYNFLNEHNVKGRFFPS